MLLALSNDKHVYCQKPLVQHTLQPTALAHEAYLRLLDQDSEIQTRRAQFLAVAARTIRRILVDHARQRGATKRGGDAIRVTLDDDTLTEADGTIDLLSLHEALDDLGKLNPRHRDVVELRFFAGLTAEEAADVLGVGPQTVRQDWRMARAWLGARLE